MDKLERKLIDALGVHDIDAAEQLLKNGANVNARNRHGETLLMTCVHSSIAVDMLIKYRADVSLKDNDGNTALHYAVSYWNNDYVIKALIDAGAPVDAMDDTGFTPLMMVSSSNNYQIARLLLERGADHTLKDREGYTAIEIARQIGNSIADEILMDYPAICQESIALTGAIEYSAPIIAERLDF